MVINFGKPEIKIEHGKWGIGDMNVHFYVSPAISEEHKQAVQEAVDEFFHLFPGKKDWFKIKKMPYSNVADIVKNQPATLKEITDLHFHYYWNKFDEIYKDNKSPLTTILVIPYIFGSGNNGTGTSQHFSTIVLDLQNTEHLKSTVKHELGHRFGVDEHCTDDVHCIMNASGVGTHFCPKCMEIMRLRIALMFMNSRPYTFGTPKKEQKNSFVFGEPIKR